MMICLIQQLGLAGLRTVNNSLLYCPWTWDCGEWAQGRKFCRKSRRRQRNTPRFAPCINASMIGPWVVGGLHGWSYKCKRLCSWTQKYWNYMSWVHTNDILLFVYAGASWRWESGGERSERDDNGNQPAQPHTHTHYQGEFNTHIKLNAISLKAKMFP